MFVKERFVLDRYIQDLIRDMEPNFGYDGLGEFIFYRTYSRFINDHQETWHDVVLRVISGIMSIRRDHYVKNHISWDEKFWQGYARDMAVSMFKMEWLPPGRGLWACGTEFVYERGSMALYSCSATHILDDIADDMDWSMDSLMLGVGVGYVPERSDSLTFKNPHSHDYFVIPDSREGWCRSIRLLVEAYQYGTAKPIFDYSMIRPEGEPIRGFGGLASGPAPLKHLHEKIEELIEWYMEDSYYDSVMLKSDLLNLIGVCVVSGNVRRSAELASLSIKDPVFKNLKDYEDAKYTYRSAWGWMSNNAVDLEQDEDFDYLYEIADRVITRGEPGIKNLCNFPQGRIGKNDGLIKDRGRANNPCGEIILESRFDIDGVNRVREVCNVDETLPTRCQNIEDWYKACEYATVYASTVSLLATHQPSTNRVVARNRRIGVSIIDGSGWIQEWGVSRVTRWLREGYRVVRKTNTWINNEAGIPLSIRVTTTKPGGTVPKLAGKTPGIGYPSFDYTLRRIIIAKNHPAIPLLREANLPIKDSSTDKYSYIVEWPIHQGPAPPAEKISLFQQAMNLVLFSREWADNAVSNTLYFKPRWVLIAIISEEKQLKWLLSEHLLERNDLIMASAKLSDYDEEFQVQDLRIKTNWSDEGDFLESRVFKYDPHHEEHDIEPVLSHIVPLIKTCSMLPHSSKGVYQDMPEEGITQEEYNERRTALRPIDWSKFSGSDGQDERFCTGAQCERPIPEGVKDDVYS